MHFLGVIVVSTRNDSNYITFLIECHSSTKTAQVFLPIGYLYIKIVKWSLKYRQTTINIRLTHDYPPGRVREEPTYNDITSLKWPTSKCGLQDYASPHVLPNLTNDFNFKDPQNKKMKKETINSNRHSSLRRNTFGYN